LELKAPEGINDLNSKNYLYFQIPNPIHHELLKKYSLQPKQYVVVHPGMMGSALNWPQKKYIDYIEKILVENKKVVITGTDSDEPYLTEIKTKYLNHPQVTWLQSKLNISELIEILDGAEHVLAPSTGVAHLAAGLGVRTVAVFSPIKVHHPRRWAPRGRLVEIIMINLNS
jgi:ADP-heptose:LPS heptosyltransferase